MIRTRLGPVAKPRNGPPSSGLVSPHKMGAYFPSGGSVSSVVDPQSIHSGGKVYQCDRCGKMYKHPNCLSKHKWEHSEHWKEASKFSLSKHQQVQMLEAASILVGFNGDTKSIERSGSSSPARTFPGGEHPMNGSVGSQEFAEGVVEEDPYDELHMSSDEVNEEISIQI